MTNMDLPVLLEILTKGISSRTLSRVWRNVRLIVSQPVTSHLSGDVFTHILLHLFWHLARYVLTF